MTHPDFEKRLEALETALTKTDDIVQTFRELAEALGGAKLPEKVTPREAFEAVLHALAGQEE